MPVVNITQTEEYQQMMRRQISQHGKLLEDLGYADEDYDVQEYVLYHALKDEDEFRNEVSAIALHCFADVEGHSGA